MAEEDARARWKRWEEETGYKEGDSYKREGELRRKGSGAAADYSPGDKSSAAAAATARTREPGASKAHHAEAARLHEAAGKEHLVAAMKTDSHAQHVFHTAMAGQHAEKASLHEKKARGGR